MLLSTRDMTAKRARLLLVFFAALQIADVVTTIGSALYRDKYEKQADGKWRIKDTAYERIYELLQPITERPNLASHYLATHGRKELTYTVYETFQKQ